MTPWIIAGVAALAAIAFALWLMWRRRNNQLSGGMGGFGRADPYGSQPWDDGYADWFERQQALEAQAAARQARQDIREMLADGDEAVVDLMLQLAGEQPGSLRSTADDDDLIRRIAESVNPDTLKVLSSASKSHVQLDQIDLTAITELKPSQHPGDTFEIERIRTADQLGGVLPEELAMPDDVFWPQVGQDGLHVVQHYEQVERTRRLYLLLDVSGSMDQHVSGTGATRMQWAAGVALKLMLRAQAGEAEYLLRYFDEKVYPLRRVTSSSEATAMVDELVRLRDSEGGTNIDAALQTAVDDMTESALDVATSDVLLITDGESRLNVPWLQSTFGVDIRLHVAMIGHDNPVLADETIVTSYERYG